MVAVRLEKMGWKNMHSQFEVLDRVKEINRVIDKAERGLPYLGSRPNKQPFYPELQKSLRNILEKTRYTAKSGAFLKI